MINGLSMRACIMLSRCGLLNGLLKMVPNIATLSLHNIRENYLQDLVEFLNLFPNVKKIIIHADPEILRKDSEVIGVIKDHPLFRNMSAIILLEVFKNAQLDSLTSKNNVEGLNPVTLTEFLTNFLFSQRNLKKLKLGYSDMRTKFPVDKANISLKLKELVIDFHSYKPLEELRSLHKFLELQSKSIEILEMKWGCPDDIFELVFAKFKKLKTLNFCFGFSMKGLSFYDRLAVNTSVTTLTICDSSKSSIKHIFKLLPNIENLVLLGITKLATLEAVAKNLKKLKTLRIGGYRANLFINQVNFLSLETLFIGSVDCNFDSMQNLMAPGLKHLFISKVRGSSNEFLNIEKLLRKFKLESLTIKAAIYANKDFFEVIRQYGSSLTSLSLNKRSVVSDGTNRIQMSELTDKDIRGLRFHDVPAKDPYRYQTFALSMSLKDQLKTPIVNNVSKEPMISFKNLNLHTFFQSTYSTFALYQLMKTFFSLYFFECLLQ